MQSILFVRCIKFIARKCGFFKLLKNCLRFIANKVNLLGNIKFYNLKVLDRKAYIIIIVP